MWIKRDTYMAMERELAALQERVVQLADRNHGLRSDILTIRSEREGLHDDLRKLLGLKPRVAADPTPAPANAAEGATMGTPASGNHQFKMKDTPRDALMRIQRTHDERLLLDDQKRMLLAIKEYEGVLKQ